jgi:hypothetical protein
MENQSNGIYRSKSAAVRAARKAAKHFYGSSYEAKEGVDYIIHPKGTRGTLREHYSYERLW